jgi:hypothetical protein
MNGPNGRLILVYPLEARIATHAARVQPATVEDDDL